MQSILAHIGCDGCRYDLHGLSDDRPCPECGHPIDDSLRMRQTRMIRKRNSLVRHGLVFLALIGVGILMAVSGVFVSHPIGKYDPIRSREAVLLSAVQLYLIDTKLDRPPSGFDLHTLLLASHEGGGPNGPYLQSARDLVSVTGEPYALVYDAQSETLDLVIAISDAHKSSP